MNFKQKGSKTNQKSKTAIIFYVLSALLFISFLLTAYNVTVYIQSLLSAGSVSLTSDWVDITLYYVNNCASFLVFAALLFGMGYVIAYIKGKRVIVKDNVVETETLVEESTELEVETETPAEESTVETDNVEDSKEEVNS